MKGYDPTSFLPFRINAKRMKNPITSIGRVALPIYLLTTLIFLAALPPLSYGQQQKPRLVVSPSLIEKGPYPPSVVGTDFLVRVEIKNVTLQSKLVNVTFTLTFNSTLLEALNATEGAFMAQAPGYTPPFRETVFTRSIYSDRIVIINYINTTASPSSYPEGDGGIATIYFRIKYQGVYDDRDTSPLNLTDIELKDDTGGTISYEPPYNATVEIHGLISTEISVINDATGDSYFIFDTNTTSLHDKFNATVRVKDVVDLNAYQVRLYCNATQLNISRAWLPTWDPTWVFFGNKTKTVGLTPVIEEWNATHNRVLVGDTILLGNTFSGDGTLAVIEFEILLAPSPPIERVFSSLNIDNAGTFLEDSVGDLIPNTKTNGHYEYLIAGSSFIDINVDPSSTSVGSNVTIWGKIIASEPKVNVNVKLYYRLNKTGERFTALATVKTNSSSLYEYVWTTTANGTFEIKAGWPGDIGTSPANSTTVFVTVKLSSMIRVGVNPKAVDALSNVTISGSLSPAKTGANVTIYLRLNRTGEEWTFLDSNLTDASGNYTLTWTATKRTLNQADQFEIKAGWPGDNQTAAANSTVVGLTVNRVSTQITMNIDRTNITLGQTVTITGNLTPARPYSGVEILYNKTKYITRVDTNGTGHFSYLYSPARNATYLLKAKWGGDPNLWGSESPVKTLTVTSPPKASSQISIEVDTANLTVKSNVTISGRIEPTPKLNTEVEILYSLDGIFWENLNKRGRYGTFVYTDEDGNYTFKWMAGYLGDIIHYDPKNVTRVIGIEDKLETGLFRLKATWNGNATVAGAESPAINVTVNPYVSSLSINVNPPSVNVGSNTTITGTLTPPRANTNITIYYRHIGSEQWIELAKVETDSNGNYNFTWTTTEAGEFELYAHWPGDPITEPANSTTALLTVATPFTIVTYLPYIGAAIIIIVILLVVYMLKFRRR